MATTSFYILFESASGYGLFSVLEQEEIGALLKEVSEFYRCNLKFMRYPSRFRQAWPTYLSSSVL